MCWQLDRWANMGMDFPGKPLDSARPKTDLKSFPSIQQELKLIAPYSNYNILHFSGLPWSGACSGKKCKISGKKNGTWGVQYHGNMWNMFHFVLSCHPFWWCGCGLSVSLTVLPRLITTGHEGWKQLSLFPFLKERPQDEHPDRVLELGSNTEELACTWREFSRLKFWCSRKREHQRCC